MEMEKIAELLKHSDLFTGLPDDKIPQLVSAGQVRSYNSGEVIIAEGDPSGELYLIQEGMVEVLIPGVAVPDFPGTPEMTAVVRLGRGQIFGEMALVDRGARSATVRCVQDDTSIFVIGRDAFGQLCESDYHIGYVVMRNLARDLSFKLRLRNLLTPRA
jgi:CRP-like cAMP-binding protein